MKKFLTVFFVFSLLITSQLPALAMEQGEIYRYEDQKPLTPQEVSILKYKMGKITVRQELGRWQIIQGINTELTDMQLLNLVNSENIAVDRLKGLEMKQTIGTGFTIAGILVGIAGGVLVSDLFKVNNGLYIGIGGIVAGLGLIFIGNSISPLIADESDHIINIEEARSAAEKYNAQFRKSLNLPDNYE
jgi:hypothetical protein